MLNSSFDSFHGTVLKSGKLAGLSLSETAYAPAVRLARHAHESAYFSFVLQGSFTESNGRRSSEYKSSTLIFHPAGESHSDYFHALTRGFNFQMENQWMQRALQHSAAFESPATFRGDFPAQLAMRLYKEFCNSDDLSSLVVEGLTLEILGETARQLKKRFDYPPPRWLVQTRELLNDQFREKLSLAQIAEAIGVHETHLSREFRRFYGCTLGEYVRRLRIEFACRRLTISDDSLTEIALAAGFFDQSHFARIFKSQTGMTPLVYRTTFSRR